MKRYSIMPPLSIDDPLLVLAIMPPVEDRDRVGDPGVRDPHAPCADFIPGEPNGALCLGDGHYLCWECERLVPYKEDEE